MLSVQVATAVVNCGARCRTGVNEILRAGGPEAGIGVGCELFCKSLVFNLVRCFARMLGDLGPERCSLLRDAASVRQGLLTALSKIPVLSEAKPDFLRSVSIVIPVYNEAANLEPLWRRLSPLITSVH